MNLQLKELAEQAGYTTDMFGVGHWDMPECQKFAELILSKVLNTVVNTDVTSVVYTSHDKDRAAAVLTLVERGLLKEFNITEKV